MIKPNMHLAIMVMSAKGIGKVGYISTLRNIDRYESQIRLGHIVQNMYEMWLKNNAIAVATTCYVFFARMDKEKIEWTEFDQEIQPHAYMNCMQVFSSDPQRNITPIISNK